MFVITRINLYRLYFLLGLIIGYVINYPLMRMRFVLYIVFPVTGVFKYTLYGECSVRKIPLSESCFFLSFFFFFAALFIVSASIWVLELTVKTGERREQFAFMYCLIRFGICDSCTY